MKKGTAAPELWHLFLTPDERIDRLNIAWLVFKLKLDFQWFVSIDGKIRFMGYDDGQSDTETTDSDESEVEMDMDVMEDLDVTEDPNLKWNIFLDVPMLKM